MEPTAASAPATRNDDYDWDAFDSDAYCAHNYGRLHDNDRVIAEKVRDFFAASGIAAGAHGVDVGPGANLYPSLAMLPFCDRLDLRELSASNVKWLRDQQAHGFDERWDLFWQIFAKHPTYANYAVNRDLRAEFRRKSNIRQDSVFTLPARAWDVGTMFFVACSLSTELGEFDAAVAGFVRSLRPDAPFAAAFMEKSAGYFVGDRWFPAVAIGADDVARSLASIAYDVKIDQIDTGNPLRDNVGMLLATGRTLGR